MIINLKTYTLLSINEKSKGDYILMEELKNNHYGPTNLYNFKDLCKMYPNNDNPYYEHFFIIRENNSIKNRIGFLAPFKNEKELLHIQSIVIHPKYRNMGNGTKILKEFSDKVFEIDEEVDNIILYAMGKYCDKAAEKAGFIYTDKYGYCGDYIKKRILK
jgi:N-acetylglutamate synthase-like GNAT family acetyltransferase